MCECDSITFLSAQNLKQNLLLIPFSFSIVNQMPLAFSVCHHGINFQLKFDEKEDVRIVRISFIYGYRYGIEKKSPIRYSFNWNKNSMRCNDYSALKKNTNWILFSASLCLFRIIFSPYFVYRTHKHLSYRAQHISVMTSQVSRMCVCVCMSHIYSSKCHKWFASIRRNKKKK